MASKLQSQQQTTTAVTTREQSAELIHKMLGQRAAELAALLGGEKMATAFRRAAASYYLHAPADAKLETVEPRSFVAACMDAAQDKLLPDGRDGWIVVRKGVAAWTISWEGMVKLARRSVKSFRDFAVEVVYREEIAAGGFVCDAAQRKLSHTPWYALGLEEPAEDSIACAYAAVTVTDAEGFTSREFAIIGDRELMKRARASGNPFDDMPSQAWAKWYPSMCRKSAVRLLMRRIGTPDAIHEALERERERFVDTTATERPRPVAPLSMATDLAGSVRAQISAGDDRTPATGAPIDPTEPGPGDDCDAP